jgi:hypothetical protein
MPPPIQSPKSRRSSRPASPVSASLHQHHFALPPPAAPTTVASAPVGPGVPAPAVRSSAPITNVVAVSSPNVAMTVETPQEAPVPVPVTPAVAPATVVETVEAVVGGTGLASAGAALVGEAVAEGKGEDAGTVAAVVASLLAEVVDKIGAGLCPAPTEANPGASSEVRTWV